MDDNLKQIKEMKEIVNKYLDSMKIKELFNEEFIDRYISDKELIDVLLDKSYSEKSLSELQEQEINKLNNIILKTNVFKDLSDMKNQAKEYIVLEKLKDLKLL